MQGDILHTWTYMPAAFQGKRFLAPVLCLLLWADPFRGLAAELLEVSLTQVKGESSQPSFKVHLHNMSDHALVLNAGIMLGNGKVQYATSIKLVLTDEHGRVLNLSLIGPALIAGRVDPLILPLPPGSTFSLPVKLEQYNDPKNNIWKLDLPTGTYALRATFKSEAVPQQQTNLDMRGFVLMPYWTGEVKSPEFQFSIGRK